MGIGTHQMWKDRLIIPSYRIGEAASYAKISPQTVAAWHKKKGAKSSSVLSSRKAKEGLSFLQLIEVAVVAEMRKLGVKLPEIERARKYFKETTGLDYPFAQLRFKTDGADVLSDIEGAVGRVLTDKVLAANHQGQYIWTEMLSSRFKEFNYDDEGAVIAWKVAGEDKQIEIDPRLAFGAPQIRGVKTSIIKSRWASGEEVDEIAEDFSLSELQVVDALLFEGMEGSDPRIARWLN